MAKILFIGGTGLISSACAELALARGHELHLLVRGRSDRYSVPAGARVLQGDLRADPAGVARLLAAERYDSVVDWVAYTPQHIEDDIRVFTGRTRQFVFISSASAYQKPPRGLLVSEDTPLINPFWQYSRDKIACEERLMRAFREQGFPVLIVRPSHTYGPSQIPICVGSWAHPWTAIDRLRRGLPLIVPGDGTSLWTLTWNADFARGFVGLLGRDEWAGHAIHITSDEALSWNDIYAEAARAVDVEPNFVHVPSDLIAAYDPSAGAGLIGDKAHSVVFDNSKIKRAVPDFVCNVSWSEGVRRSLAWFEADPVRQTIDAAANSLWDRILEGYARAWPR
ncbi:MAG: SDR family oxidoreductase [Chloroflexi bacterium]|nr:SDR family oxidoreductase [Chloroflexota bacterium]